MAKAISMKIKYPGLIREVLPSGNTRWRVRVERQKTKRIVLHVAPGDQSFQENYLAARRGIEIKPEMKLEDRALKGSVSWLIYCYLENLGQDVKEGVYSQATLKQRENLLSRLHSDYGDYDLNMPQTAVVQIRDGMRATPGAADNMTKALRSMFTWGGSVGHCTSNPAVGVGKLNRNSKGATPWTIDDLKKYRQVHPPGTTAHLCLTLFMFTACRISDAIWLGRELEFERSGILGLGWQPRKKGSAYVEIPMLPPLLQATRAAKIQGKTYLLTEHGQPFASPESLRNRFKKWCDVAGLANRSSHGIRKATGHLLAQEGCTQYQIMTIHGHSEAKTSEIYTEGVERWNLARAAMDNLRGMEW
ncbi:tyrosine-type recombinase/integrase [Pseudovibrio sp. Tun.PSC04-5.I4]|uniref:tyrosine-type recombinase/integrase n=1 Tax=Pseudovibrio sp. Tun.PSC04-5.I4 TaxID=1798213 RepID=UPI000886EAB7|nr:tyrosine-type recombinase/integrase [Pseudovibrio sp. Tun.PSC04-5.I4]SDR34858.1 Phage integrase family protein [Pseudovibrio sp. Tun.PSC04-5.I4]